MLIIIIISRTRYISVSLRFVPSGLFFSHLLRRASRPRPTDCQRSLVRILWLIIMLNALVFDLMYYYYDQSATVFWDVWNANGGTAATDLYTRQLTIHCAAWVAAQSKSTVGGQKYMPPMVTDHCKSRRFSFKHNWFPTGVG